MVLNIEEKAELLRLGEDGILRDIADLESEILKIQEDIASLNAHLLEKTESLLSYQALINNVQIFKTELGIEG